MAIAIGRQRHGTCMVADRHPAPEVKVKVKDVMQREVTTVAEDESLGLALQVMLWNERRHVPVLRPADGRVVGVIAERDILRAYQHDPQRALQQQARMVMKSPPEHIHPDAEMADAAALLVAKRIGCLPVIEVGELVGIVTAADVLGTVAQCSIGSEPKAHQVKLPGRPVRQYMTVAPHTIGAEQPLPRARASMNSLRVRHLPVLHGGQLVGVVSERDIALIETLKGIDPEKVRVEEAMSPWVWSVHPDTPREVVAATMAERKYGCVVVIDGGAVAGIVTTTDIARALAGLLRESKDLPYVRTSMPPR
jgi:acetoin utilization protein AcuB